ncbi:hypothetical protein [Paenibacillus sp. BIC5C1]|uniref:hypothetical protein n=1 Tax=Paenibacillus sp. BIC5C1 TaxID=3078263 RepID=UPI0028E97062|nr:hypothetical protein [Paenibacillus sp. BIC5C1]
MSIKKTPKLIKCFEHGELIRTVYDKEETWIFNSIGYESVNINCTLIQALDDLSMEGWELICKGEQQGYILRKPAEKEEPQPLD